MSTGQVLFEQNKRQREQLRELVTLLTDLIDGIGVGQDVDPIVDRAKRYLLIDTNLSLDYLDDD